MTDRIKAARYFGIDRWPRLRLAALKLALQEAVLMPGHRDTAKIKRVHRRFRTGAAFAFYTRRPELFW